MNRRSPEREARARALRREVAAYMEEIREVLPEVLRRLREEATLSMYELENCTGVKRQTISEMEGGNRRACLLTFAGLALVIAGNLTALSGQVDAALGRLRRQKRQQNGTR